MVIPGKTLHLLDAIDMLEEKPAGELDAAVKVTSGRRGSLDYVFRGIALVPGVLKPGHPTRDSARKTFTFCSWRGWRQTLYLRRSIGQDRLAAVRGLELDVIMFLTWPS